MNIITIIGARPQFIKSSVLSRFIHENKSFGINEVVIHTGQHYDKNMYDVFFKEMNIPMPEVDLKIKSGNHGKSTGLMIGQIEDEIIKRKPDAVLVYGDTNSTLAGALAASKLHIPIAHVEAGLRSFMMIMPEEQNRRLTDHLSTWLFCPNRNALDNLRHEGIVDHNEANIKPSSDNKSVSISGDIMYDASLYYRTKNPFHTDEKDFFLLTIHRAENTDNEKNLISICNAINELSSYKFIFPVHPRTMKIIKDKKISLSHHIKMINPVGYFEMMALELACNAILTDSGGIQKEAYFYKKPCVTLRESTEWVELVEEGWNILSGADTEKIINAVKNLSIPSKYPSLYGDGNCAKYICDILTK
ncbi:MAG: UDP-N-acetylglucosamine 2-epimerase (non-hydrolyzing) [Methanobrevibacter sp.]|nr:UDP-N-acetylglucosamine 2-epimerase (non-hydrolyzing) [Methanobrevibacter sp.]